MDSLKIIAVWELNTLNFSSQNTDFKVEIIVVVSAKESLPNNLLLSGGMCTCSSQHLY